MDDSRIASRTSASVLHRYFFASLSGLLLVGLVGLVGNVGTVYAQEQKIRKLAPGVETYVPLKRAENETNAEHDIVEVIVGHPDRKWVPEEFESSGTLYAKAEKILFHRGIWQFQFVHKPLRMIEVDIPQPDGKMRIQYRNYCFSEFLGTLVDHTPRSVQFHIAAAAERILNRLTPQQTYRIQSLLQQVLDAAPEAGSAVSTASDATASGIDACHDLRQLIEDLTDAAAMPIDAAGEPVHTVENLSKLFDVSTKTISRWRRQGLIGRKFIIDGRKRVGFLKSSVDRFISGNRKQIERGSRFRQMTNQERKQIISEARRLSLTGCGMNEIAKQLAMELQRSPGTIRGTVKQYDQSHPELAIFPTNGAPLHEELRKKVFALYQQGRSIDQIAEQFKRSSSTILRIVSMQRYEYIHNLPLDHVSHPSFSKIRNLVSVLGPMPENAATAKKARVPSDLPSYLASLYEVPLLSREQEQHLFRKLNFAKYRANRLRSTLNAEQPQAKRMDEIEQLYDTAVATKNQIVRANLRPVRSQITFRTNHRLTLQYLKSLFPLASTPSVHRLRSDFQSICSFREKPDRYKKSYELAEGLEPTTC